MSKKGVEEKMVKCDIDCPFNEEGVGCCCECPNKKQCDSVCEHDDPKDCGHSIFIGSDLEVFKEKAAKTLSEALSILKQKKMLEEREKEIKTVLLEQMEKHGIKKFSNDYVSITYVAESTSTTLDSSRIKVEQPDLFDKYKKTSKKSAYVKIDLSKGVR